MKQKPAAEGKRWLKQAENDLNDAEFNLKGGRFHLACFLAQQSAEKAFKAYLYTEGEEELWTHSVAELCTRAGRIDTEFQNIKQEASALDKYYVPTRYPNALPGGVPSEAFEEKDALRAIEICRNVIKLVREEIKGEKEK